MIAARPAIALLAAAALAACTPPEDAPTSAPEPAAPATTAPASAAVRYACQSGRTVDVTYGPAETASIVYQNQTYALRSAPSASGARYAGSGMEWWSAVRDGRDGGTLSRTAPGGTVGVTVLETCTGPAPAQTPVAPPPGAEPAAAPCKTAQLKATNEGGDAGMGNRVAVIGLQNTGAQACSLTGYPVVTLLDGRARPLSTVKAEQQPGNYFGGGTGGDAATTAVTLAPQAKAFFDIAWNVVPHEGEGERVCPSAATVRIAPPGDAATTSLALSFTPCGSRIRVRPFRPVVEDAPSPEPMTEA